MQKNDQRILALDGLRGIAALTVIGLPTIQASGIIAGLANWEMSFMYSTSAAAAKFLRKIATELVSDKDRLEAVGLANKLAAAERPHSAPAVDYGDPADMWPPRA